MVTLHGSVQSYRRKLIAQEVAALSAAAEGWTIGWSRRRAASDGAVLDHVRAALEAHADITKATITVSVEGGMVSLGGTVGRAWSAPGRGRRPGSARGPAVRNYVLVDAGEQEEDEALSRAIAAALAERGACAMAPSASPS